jgi:hypothetical protein
MGHRCRGASIGSVPESRLPCQGKKGGISHLTRSSCVAVSSGLLYATRARAPKQFKTVEGLPCFYRMSRSWSISRNLPYITQGRRFSTPTTSFGRMERISFSIVPRSTLALLCLPRPYFSTRTKNRQIECGKAKWSVIEFRPANNRRALADMAKAVRVPLPLVRALI